MDQIQNYVRVCRALLDRGTLIISDSAGAFIGVSGKFMVDDVMLRVGRGGFSGLGNFGDEISTSFWSLTPLQELHVCP